MATFIQTIPAGGRRVNTRKLFVRSAVLISICVFAGFSRTYYLHQWFGLPNLSVFLHAHGFAMTLWIALFLIQTLLVSARMVSLHRNLGILGLVSAVLVVLFGTSATIIAARRQVLAQASNVPLVITVLALELTQMLMFATLVTGGLLLRTRPDYHKRLLLLGTLAMLPNAIVRVTSFWPSFILPLVLWSLSIGLVCLIDSIGNRRLHPVFKRWAIVEIASLWLAYSVGISPAWQHFARYAVGYRA